MSDLPENEVQNLKSFIVGPVQQDGLQESNSLASEKLPCELTEGIDVKIWYSFQKYSFLFHRTESSVWGF